MVNEDLVRRAAAVVAEADALLVGAGAGMGVDSGLPDFRGAQGFWRAYPLYQKLGLDFIGMANPRWFATDPAFAWGFYGHRLELYRRTEPHPGFAVLARWAARMKRGSFVYTSNVDGHFQKAGFDARSHPGDPRLDPLRAVHAGMPGDRARRRVPRHHRPGDPPRLRPPAALRGLRRDAPAQHPHVRRRLLGRGAQPRPAGAARRLAGGPRRRARGGGGVRRRGRQSPRCASFCQRLARKRGALVRINVREAEVPPEGIGLAAPALEALEAMDRIVTVA